MANFKVIRDLCEAKKITIRELASRIGVKENTVHKVIQNNSTSTTTIEDIAKVLEVPVGVFFDNNNTITQNGGKKNAASIYGNVSTCDIESCQLRISHLERLLEEKEKQITLLNKICEIQKK